MDVINQTDLIKSKKNVKFKKVNLNAIRIKGVQMACWF